LGASVWWPNKDTQADEPDSQRVALTVPDPLINVSNGRLRSVTHHADHTTTWEWFAANPINNYAIAVATGAYTHFSDTLIGEKGKLSVDYYPLAIHLDAARRQWPQNAIPMLKCFEHWFGPYPWYEDGYKLIEVPNSGMEHQTAVSYGNGFRDGYNGRGASLRFRFDFIIIHESAHEWFANNITAKDQADMWIHESFANYAEGLFAECKFNSADSGAAHIRLNSRGANRAPLIAHYGVNDQPPGDMYGKGGWMLHTIRQVVDNSEKWRQVLRGLNREFWHQTVTTRQIEDYMTKASGKDLTRIFDQYLRTTMIPVFEYKVEGDTLSYHWTNVIPGFDMPIKVMLADSSWSWVTPTERWQTATLKLTQPGNFKVDPNFLATARQFGEPEPPVR
jgi:aminopeptidase N